jgi:hypothetical protein
MATFNNMTSKDDVVVGCVTGYDFETIKPWVNSLDTCGFDGHKVVLAYNLSKDVIAELTSRKYTILAFNQDQEGNVSYKDGQPFSIVVERFFHLWAMLKGGKGKHRYLVHTDMKDVIFQRNPSLFLEERKVTYELVAASESIDYEHEAWGRQNLIDSFGQLIYEHKKHHEIFNAGTLSGSYDTLVDFFLNVYMVSVGGKTHNPDQAAVNVLLLNEPYAQITRFISPHVAWACQAGTTNDPSKIDTYREHLIGPHDHESYFDPVDNLVKNYHGEPFYIVHQYDRVPNWRDAIWRKYA